MSTTYTVKLRRKRPKKPFFVERGMSVVASGSEIIGKPREAVNATITINLPTLNMQGEESKVVQVTKNVRLLGEASEYTVDSFRYGKDVKNTKNLLNDKLTTNIALSDEGINDGDDEFSSGIGVYNFGQSQTFKYVDDKFNLIPYRDIAGKPNAASFLTLDQSLIDGFPYVYNRRTNYDQYIDSRDRIYFNGVIDVFHTHLRNSEISDILLRGVKVVPGQGNFNETQNTTSGKKGSPLESSVFETISTQHDFFEDCQDIILNLTGSASQVGFVSTGKFKLSPFAEQDTFKNDYSHMTTLQKNTLLVSSSMQDFEIGTRFKSKQNGFIINPFYKLTEQKSFGTDSIAFRGLSKG